MSDEDDYMSDSILRQCGDTRPGLVSRGTKRKYVNANTRKKTDGDNQTKPKRVLEAEMREEGLKNALGSDNKGFALLSKMGYKPGMGLGKEGRKGRVEPVTVELKDGRMGLGHASERKRLRTEAIAMRHEMLKRRHKINEHLQKDFRSRLRSAQMEKEVERDLLKSQRVCFQLDAIEEMENPIQSFYWIQVAIEETTKPATAEDDEDESDNNSELHKRLKTEESEEEDLGEDLDEIDFTNNEKLQMLTSYLRSTYLYCVWCGTKFDDAEDMQQNCSGDTAEDHND